MSERHPNQDRPAVSPEPTIEELRGIGPKLLPFDFLAVSPDAAWKMTDEQREAISAALEAGHPGDATDWATCMVVVEAAVRLGIVVPAARLREARPSDAEIEAAATQYRKDCDGLELAAHDFEMGAKWSREQRG